MKGTEIENPQIAGGEIGKIGRREMSLALVALTMLLGGCAAMSTLPVSSMVSSPNASALEIHNSTELRLQEKNFIVVKTNVMGESSGFSLLGIVTIVPAKFTKAMSRLYAKAEMTPGRAQTLANVVMNSDSTYFILFSLPRTSVRADVVEFIPANLTATPPEPPPDARSAGK